MHCPVCKDPQLVISERQGIEIDYCPSCRGVWLDRGELDKLIEKSNVMNQPSPVSSYQQESLSRAWMTVIIRTLDIIIRKNPKTGSVNF